MDNRDDYINIRSKRRKIMLNHRELIRKRKRESQINLRRVKCKKLHSKYETKSIQPNTPRPNNKRRFDEYLDNKQAQSKKEPVSRQPYTKKEPEKWFDPYVCIGGDWIDCDKKPDPVFTGPCSYII